MMELHNYRTEGEHYSYLLLTQPYGKYDIDDTEVDNLNSLIIKKKKDNQDFGLLERHLPSDNFEPLFYDFDFRFKSHYKLDNKFLKKLVSVMQNVLNTFVVDPNLIAYTLLKSTTSDFIDNKHKFGIHIMFPYICLDKKNRLFIYNKMYEVFSEQKLFDDFETSLKKIFDKQVIYTNAILKYGCNKPNSKRYELYKIYDGTLNEIENKHSEKQLIDLLSIRKNNWLEPKIVSKLNITILDEPKKLSSIQESYVDFNDVKTLLDVLSEERASNYEDWIKVGLCLNNISSSSEMMDMWKQWSEKCKNKSVKTNFEGEWKKFKQRKDGGLGYGSLIYWAEQDNPSQFKKYYLDKLHKKIKSTLDFNVKTTPLPHDIAQVLKQLYYKKKYICGNIKGNKWYEFRNHIWVPIAEGFALYNNISEELYMIYAKQNLEIRKKVITIDEKLLEPINDSEKEALLDEKIRLANEEVRLTKLLRCLKETTFKDKLMKECKNLFYDERFETNLNEKRNLIAFNNGIYDLDKCEFRDGNPDDYLSYSTRINFIEYDETLPEIHKVYSVFSQIHTNQKMFDFNFCTLAQALHGYKKEQIFNCWTGCGSNGKTISVDFISKALGDYFHAPSITMLTQKRTGSSNATPDLYKLKGVRIAVVQEPEHDDKLNTSMLKQLTGGDPITCRELHSSPIEFKPQLSMFMACNDLPKIPSTDGGTWRRIRVQEFKSKFVDKPSAPNEFYKDPSLSSQIENLSEAFMSILLHYHNQLKNNERDFEIPEEVVAYTNEYKKDNDPIQDFIDDMIEVSEKDIIKLKDLHSIFIDWFKSNYPNKKAIDNVDFKRKMESKIGVLPHRSRGWKGYKLKDEDDDFNSKLF